MGGHVQRTKKHALTATAAIFLSRCFGLIREQIFAFFFGAGVALDAFIVAFRVPNLLRDLFAEGALSQSFVTVFANKLAGNDDHKAFQLANKVATFLALLVGTLVILGIVFSPQLVRLFATGFTGEKFILTVKLMRLMFPFIFFVSLAALLMGMLNAKDRFFLPQSASTFFNITSIVVGLIFAYVFSPDYTGETWQKLLHGTRITTTDFLSLANAITGMALGTVIGGFVQLVIQLPSLLNLGFKPRLDFNFKDNDLIKILKLTGPAIIGGAAVQVNVLVNTEFASLLGHGPVSYLNFAFRFMQFPLGLFGVAIATASAPALAKLLSEKNAQDFRHTMQSSLSLSLFFTIPSMVGLCVLGNEIIALIYEHGHFTATDTRATALALLSYSLGIASYALIKVYQPAYLAFHNAKTSMRISLFSMVTNLALNSLFLFVFKLPFWSLALGTSCVALINLLLLVNFFRPHMPDVWSRASLINFGKILLASVIMGLCLYFALPLLHTFFSQRILSHKLFLVLLPLFMGVLIYLTLGFLLKIPDARFFAKK